MGASDDPRRVHFQSPEYFVDRLDAIAELFDKDRTDLLGRVKLEDEAFDFRVSMAEIERLSEGIAWIDLSFVERKLTPRWAIEVGSAVTWLVCCFEK